MGVKRPKSRQIVANASPVVPLHLEKLPERSHAVDLRIPALVGEVQDMSIRRRFANMIPSSLSMRSHAKRDAGDS